MKVVETELPGVLLLEPQVFGDERGFFVETFQAERYQALGIEQPFVQDNWSRSRKGILRGLHLQHPHAQGKLVMVTHGSVFDVAVDVRKGSTHFGRWMGSELSEQNKRQLWIPPGFAHGFCVTSEYADFLYKCTEVYAPKSERCLAWNDPTVGVKWPITDPLISKKDAAGLTLDQLIAELHEPARP